VQIGTVNSNLIFHKIICSRNVWDARIYNYFLGSLQEVFADTWRKGSACDVCAVIGAKDCSLDMFSCVDLNNA